MVTWILRSILVLLSVFAVKSTGNWIFQCRARVDNGSCICWAGFAGYDASYAEFLLVVGRTGMLGIFVGMDRKERYAARCFTVVVLDTLVTCLLLSTTGASGFTVPKNCGGPAVAVLFSSSISLSWCRGRFPWSSCSEDHGDSAVAVFFLVVDASVVQPRRGTHSAIVQKSPLVQFLGKVVALRVVQRQMRGSMVLHTVVVPRLQSIEGRRHPFRAAETDPHGLALSEDHRDSPVAVHVVVDAPVKQVAGSRSSTSLSRRRGLLPWSGLFVGPEFPLLLDKVVDAFVCRSCRFHRSTSSLSWRKGSSPCSGCSVDHGGSSVAAHIVVDVPFPSRSHPCRGAETVSHGLADHGDSAVLLRQGDRRQSSTGAVVVKTVVLPQLHLS